MGGVGDLRHTKAADRSDVSGRSHSWVDRVVAGAPRQLW